MMEKMWRMPFLAACCFVIAAGASAQDDRGKLAPALQQGRNKKAIFADSIYTLSISVTELKTFKERLALLHEPVRIIREYEPAGLLVIRCRYGNFVGNILPLSGLRFADRIDDRPTTEQPTGGSDLSANAVAIAQRAFPSIDGSGLVVSVREDRFDSTDIDLRGRIRSTPQASTLYSTHATIMATLIGGAGNSFYSGRGVAPGVVLTSFNFNSLLPDADSVYHRYGISVQNHSYGSAVENYYGNEAMAYDVHAHHDTTFMHVFSAGNGEGPSDSGGRYAAISGMANLTGNYKQAKNIVTVGSTDSFGNVLAPSSKGPAFDGRIKPELAAFGQEGSSGAAAIVSGISLLLQQAYRQQENGQLPSSALLRAVLFNSADDTGLPGPDLLAGYGRVNAYRSLRTMLEKKYVSGGLHTGETLTYPISIPSNMQRCTITLAWNDPAAEPGAGKALVNDLDLEFISAGSGQTWLPWTLSSYPATDSLLAAPLRKKDSLNNAEQVSLDHPPAGDYLIRIKGSDIPLGPQTFSVAYSWDSADTFIWTWPVGNAPVLPGVSNLLRWETGFDGTGSLAYSTDQGVSWIRIEEQVMLDKKYFSWKAPDTNTTVILRMQIGSALYFSEPFAIAKPLPLSVGFDCPDSVLLYWPVAKGVSGYEVYQLGDRSLQPLAATSDTMMVLGKADHPSMYYSVAALLPNSDTGVKSYTIDYSTQGVGCFIRTFTADKGAGPSALLTLTMATLYQVATIRFEKRSADGGYQTLASIQPGSEFVFTFMDDTLLQGLNVYRVTITLVYGRVIHSDQELIYFTGSQKYLLYPNPVAQQSTLQVLSDEPFNTVLQLFDMTGRKVLERRLSGNPAGVPVSGLAKGMYLFSILKDGKRSGYGKLIIQ